MKVQIILSENGKTYAGEAILTPTGTPPKLHVESKKRVSGLRPGKPSEALERLYQANFFKDERTLSDTMKELSNEGFNFSGPSVLMALKSKKFLQRRGNKGSYRFIQKYPATG